MNRLRARALVLVVALLGTGCSGEASSDVTLPREPASVAAGEVLYGANCAACHGIDLQGGRSPGGYRAPSLAAKVGPDDAILIEIVKRGRGLGMPSFATLLDESEIASIIDYIRTVQADQLDE